MRMTVSRTALLAAVAFAVAACSGGARSTPAPSRSRAPVTSSGLQPTGDHPGIDKIEHVIMINMENRSFDSYFGTYPGADGIPMKDGKPTVCSPNPRSGTCDPPYHEPSLVNGGGPHGR